MIDWETTTLGEIVKSGEGILQTGPFGSQLHASDYVKEGIPCIMPANIQNTRIDLSKIAFINENDARRLSKHITKVGDLIFSRRGDITLKALIRKEQAGFFCGTGCILVRPGQKIDSEYLIYYLSTPSSLDWILSKAVGATMPNINTKILSNYPINLPPREIQSQISKILSDIDSKIELNNKINVELESMSKLIYNYWFVQFDFPDENGKPYKSSGGKMVWCNDLKREIPEGWLAKRIEELSQSINTGLNPRDHFRLGEGENSYVTIRNIEYGRISFDSCDKINENALQRIQQRSKLDKGDILFTSIEPVGKTYLLFEKPSNWNINESVFSFKPNSQFVSPEFLFMLLSSDEIKIKCRNASTGSIHQGIRITPLKAFYVQYCGIELINKFTTLIFPILKNIDSNQNQNQELTSLRDWLLPMLMNGQVTVSETTKETKTSEENYIKRKQLALQILAKSRIDLQLGKVKFEKLLHLCEYYAVKENTNQQFQQHAAGPYDPAFTHRFFGDAKKEQFASVTKHGAMHKIEVSKTIDSHLQADLFNDASLKKMDELIQHFMGSNHEKPEVISTLYAVWNNRIIRNELLTDELLKQDFLAWDKGKEQYKNQLDRNLKWMRDNGIVPDGWGKEIRRN